MPEEKLRQFELRQLRRSRRGLQEMIGRRGRRLIRDFAVALAAGLAVSLIAVLALAHLVVILSAGILACAVVITVLELVGGIKRQSPLVVRIKGRPQWRNWKNAALIVAVNVEVTNSTGEPIQIDRYAFTYEAPGGRSWDAQLSEDDVRAVNRELNSARYFPPLRQFVEVPPHESVSGWYVAAVTRDPTGGTPGCTLILRDTVGNRYKATVPAQEPRVYAT